VEPKPPRAVLGATVLPGVETRLGVTEVRAAVVVEDDLKIGRDQWLPPPVPYERDVGQGCTADVTPCMSVPEITGAPGGRGAVWAAGVHWRGGIIA
jgi:hypothetical protein